MTGLFTIIAFTENSPGVLQRITDLVTRRKINIESLTVSETERKGISRFTIGVNADHSIMQKIVKQINRVIEVEAVHLCQNKDLIFKEIAFFKVNTTVASKRAELEELAHRYGAPVIHAESDYLVIEKTGEEDDINSLFLLFEPFGIREFIRSGRIAILKHGIPVEENVQPVKEEGSEGAM